MSRLQSFFLEFQSPLYPTSRLPPPPTRSVPPKLTFKGVHEYSEDLLAQIEAPLLNELTVKFFMDIDFVLPQLRRLISQAEWFKTCDRATVCTCDEQNLLKIYKGPHQSPYLFLHVICSEFDSQLASLAQRYFHTTLESHGISMAGTPCPVHCCEGFAFML
ncbi:hypothetical protein F5148DRAFT_1225184 [Russula earlei]|uniref:Uncharacterized protein n=1 Tax=Russula earlei TaxID=71964 RepID=A0ACC0U070_9AGAM|nr:hypothetical protein F5148DRAFT_1225184 [Russula earlei]